MSKTTNQLTINSDAIEKISIEGPSTPFHAMQEEDDGAGQGISMVPIASNDSSKASKYEEFDEENDLKVYHGHADFDRDIHASQICGSKWYFGKTKRAAIKVLYLSVFAVVGAFLRIILAQLFGEECKNPGSVGWLKAGSPLCVTANGEASMEGGIIFSDLPANLLGSFVMGMMQTTDTMGLPKIFPIAWLNENNSFQTFDIIHLAISSGLCGSLTTFSSWNSEMVLMMLGADADRVSLIFRALLGYLIGVETALASFILGKNTAKYLHSRVNAPLQKEAQEVMKKKECGVYINTQLSDYERRYLSELDMAEYTIYVDPAAEQYLHQWRVSTRENRRVGDHMLPLLTDIEYTTLVMDDDVDQEMVVPAMMAKWDLDALNKWRELKRHIPETSVSFIEPREFRFAPAFRVAFLCMALLVTGIVMIHGDDVYSITYRLMIYSAFFAPVGALLRWKFSKWNGKWNRFSWFPLGTLVANLLACIVSAIMIGMEYRLNGSNNFWSLGTIRAIKVGFAGSLSTVSTFINEFADLLSSESPIHAYLYVIVSIFLCAATSALFYFGITYKEEPVVYYRNGYGYGY
jgi:Integral membrane protein possibly involved in chromosome condensation